MIYRLSVWLTKWFIAHGYLEPKDYDVYVYCIDSLLAKIIFYRTANSFGCSVFFCQDEPIDFLASPRSSTRTSALHFANDRPDLLHYALQEKAGTITAACFYMLSSHGIFCITHEQPFFRLTILP